jgi:signal transduction histidine kinase
VSGRRADSADARLVRGTALRVGLQSATAVAATVVLLCAVAVLVVLRSQHDEQDALLDAAIQRADDVVDPPAGAWLVVQSGDQTAASPGLPAGLPDQDAIRRAQTDHAGGTTNVSINHREYRVRTEAQGNTVVQAILDLRAAHIGRDRLVRALLMAGVAGLLLAGATGALVARRAVAPLVHALALQRRFVADAGHELRTPLTLLSTRAQLLRRHLRQLSDDDPAKSDVDGLVADANQLAAILDDLLLAADPREDAARQPVELAALVRQAVAAAQPAAQERQVRILVEGDDAPILVTGSEAGLRRAVNALLDNGIRHARGTLRVVLLASGRQVRLDVVDDGPGIDQDVLPNLFTRFASTPADGAPSARRRYGLGLSLVSEIVARHGGSVSAHSTKGAGATLRLELPVDRDQRRRRPRSSWPAGRADS